MTSEQSDARVGESADSQLQNWGTHLVEQLLYPLAIFVTPLFIACLVVYLIILSFIQDTAAGIRSFSAVLLPLMILTYLIKKRHDAPILDKELPRWATFLIMLVLGVVVMGTLTLHTSAPVTELVLSGAFAVLVFSYVSLEREKMISFYFGTILGFLIYVVLLGFPALE
jgi:hypothetical protein